MKNIKILCLCFGFFSWNSVLNGAAIAEDLGASAAKSLNKSLAKSSAWGERFNMAFDLGMPMGTAMAASNANEFLSEVQADVFKDFQDQTDTVTNGLKSWAAKQRDLHSKQMNAISSYFFNQSSAINNSQASAEKNAQAEANYLFQNLSLQQPASNLVSLAGASSFDQLFSTAIMATPASNFTWYNVLGLGDWVFDPTTNSFWQNQAVPFPSKNTDASTQASNIDVLSSNNIFVEYYPSQKPYTIT